MQIYESGTHKCVTTFQTLTHGSMVIGLAKNIATKIGLLPHICESQTSVNSYRTVAYGLFAVAAILNQL